MTLLKTLLSHNLRDNLRLYQQKIISGYGRAKWIVSSFFSKRALQHYIKRFKWTYSDLESLPSWMPYIPSKYVGEKKILSDIIKNSNTPQIFGRPQIWPKPTRCFPQKELAIFSVKKIFATHMGHIYDYKGLTLRELWLGGPPVIFHKILQRKLFGIDTKLGNQDEKALKIENAIIIQQTTNKTYGHFLMEVLPRMVMAREECDNSMPIYFTTNHPVYITALEMLGIDSKRFISAKEFPSIKVENAYIPKYIHRRGWMGATEYLQHAIKEIIESSQTKSYLPNLKKRLFIKRPAEKQKNINRSSMLLNVDEIEHELLLRGFETIHPEKMSFEEQVLAFNNAEVVLGEHGSALFNTIFCKKNTLVFDIHAAKPTTALYDTIKPLDIHYIAIVNPEGSMVKWKIQKYTCSMKPLNEALDAHNVHRQ